MLKGLHNVEYRIVDDLAKRQVARFWAKVRKTTAGCWLWTGTRVGGPTHGRYGYFNTPRGCFAHRFSYELHHGPIPDGLEILHSCDNGLCVNPAHLSVGTHTDNMRDAASKRRLSVPRPRRHKVTTEQLAVIDDLLASGATCTSLANRFGVSTVWMSLYARGLRRQYDRPHTSPSLHPSRAAANAAHPSINLQGATS